MYVRQTATCVVVHTPAKLNLSLEVLGKRTDGYHEIETLMVPVGIFDTLQFTPTDGPDITLACRWGLGLAAQMTAHAKRESNDSPADQPFGDLPSGERNIVWRAVALLRKRAGMTRGADIRLIKRTPAAAGLGGASSDAAAALKAANLAWGLKWSSEELKKLGAEVGSDVPFFLSGGAGVCHGRGEYVEPAPAAWLQVVVVRPPVGLSTPEVYKQCRLAASPKSSQPLLAPLARGMVAGIARNLHNRLEEPAARLTPWIGRLRDEFSRHAPPGHQMSGSGSSYFGLARSARHARRLAARMRGRRMGVAYAAATTTTGTH